MKCPGGRQNLNEQKNACQRLLLPCNFQHVVVTSLTINRSTVSTGSEFAENLKPSKSAEHPFRPEEYCTVSPCRWNDCFVQQKLYMGFNRVISPMLFAQCQQFNIGEIPTIILYTYTTFVRWVHQDENVLRVLF